MKFCKVGNIAIVIKESVLRSKFGIWQNGGTAMMDRYNVYANGSNLM